MTSKATAAGGATSLKHPLKIDMHTLPSNSSICYSKLTPNQIKMSAKPSQNHTVRPSWVTGRCNEKVSGLGIFQWSYVVEHMGQPELKKCYLGCVPAHFNDFDERIYKGGGWCFGSDGIFCGEVEGAKMGQIDTGISFGTGDRVTIRLDTDKQYIQIFVGSKKTSSTLKLIDFDYNEGVYPAFSIFNYSCALKCESVSDVSVLSMLARELQAAPWDRNTWERLHGRMLETEKIQMNENGKKVELSKEDVKYRMIVWGDVETWHKELGTMLTDDKLEAKVRAAARSSQNNFLNSIFHLFDKQKSEFMDQVAEQSTLITSLITRMDKQEHEFNKKLKVLEDMVVQANEQANFAETSAQDALKLGASNKAQIDLGDSTDRTGPNPFTGAAATNVRRKSSVNPSNGADVFPHPKNAHSSSHDLHKSANSNSIPRPPQNNKPGSTSSATNGAKKPSVKQPVLDMAKKKKAGRIANKSKMLAVPGAGGASSLDVASSLRPKNKQSTAGMRTVDMSAAGNTQVMQGVRQIFMMDAEVQAIGEQGSPDDALLKRLEDVKKNVGLKKLDVAKLLLQGSPCAKTEDSKMEIAELVETLVNGGDHVPGNYQLVSAMIHQIPTIDWAKVINDRNLAPIAAFDGSLKFLDLILSVPQVKVDTVELVEACFFNQTARIPCAQVLLNHDDVLDLAEYEDDISAVWQEFFEDIAAESRAIPKENRTGRMELITAMLAHPTFTMDFTMEGSDGLTCFSRACKENDVDLINLLMEKKLVDVNHVTSDTTTALIQAVIGNAASAAEFLCLASHDLDVNHVSTLGSALYLATSLNRKDVIVHLEGKKAVSSVGE